MTIAGVIGGIGPESTIDYYKSIIAEYRRLRPDGGYPAVIINSVNLDKLVGHFTNNELAAVADYLVSEVERLARAGADFAVLSANTPHIVFDEVAGRVGIPMISIVEATADAVQARNVTRPALLGTRFTMQSAFYRDAFARHGLTLAIPEPDEQQYIHDRYMNELIKGIFLPETRARLLGIVDRLRERHGIDGLILGGTELPLILQQESHGGVLFFDTTKIHVARIVAALLA